MVLAEEGKGGLPTFADRWNMIVKTLTPGAYTTTPQMMTVKLKQFEKHEKKQSYWPKPDYTGPLT